MSSRRHAVRVAADGELRVRDQPVGAGETCRRILKTLPTWFGIPASVEDDVAAAAEVHVMAVLPELHRQAIGRALLGHAEGILAADGVEFLQVKTLAPSKPDDGYDKTRAFYLAYGFRPLEEFRNLWDAENPALQMIKVIPKVGVTQ